MAQQTSIAGPVTVDPAADYVEESLSAPPPAYPTLILSESSLTNYWQLQETSGTTAIDSKGSNNGTYIGGYTLNQPALTPLGKSITLAGTSLSPYSPINVPTFSIPGPLSIEIWYKLNATGNSSQSGFFIAKRPWNSEWNLFTFGGTLTARGGSNTGGATATTPVDTNWHHLVSTYSGTTAQLYLDGHLMNTATITAINNDVVSGTNDIAIGSEGTSALLYPFIGNICHLALYNAVLSPTQVMNHYISGTGVVPKVIHMFNAGRDLSKVATSISATGASITDGGTNLEYFDGFDDYQYTQINRYWTQQLKPTQNSATVNSYPFDTNFAMAPNGRNGSSSLRMMNAQGNGPGAVASYTGASQQTRTVGFALNATRFSDPNVVVHIAFGFADANTLQCWVQVNSDGTMSVIKGGYGTAQTILATSSQAILLGVFYYVEFSATIHNTNGAYTLKVNGVTWLTVLTGANTRYSANNSANQVFIGAMGPTGNSSGSIICDFDDFYCRIDNTFLGDVRVETKFPTGDGFTTNFAINGTAGTGLVPAMTANNQPPFVVVGSTENNAAWGAFDGAVNTVYWSPAGAAPAWLRCDLASPRPVGSYTIGMQSTSGSQGPKTWTFEGSPDGTNFTVLDTQTNAAAWGAAESRTYTLSAIQVYRYYRLNISVGQTGGIQIGTFQVNSAVPSSHYQAVNDVASDDDATFNASSAANDVDLYAYPPLTATSGAVYGVMPTPVLRNDSAGTVQAATEIRQGVNNYDGTPQNIGSTTYIGYPQIYGKDPSTGNNWTVGGVNSAQYGVKRIV
jgi:hypothetical protein